jgi:hypothetical protein
MKRIKGEGTWAPQDQRRQARQIQKVYLITDRPKLRAGSGYGD